MGDLPMFNPLAATNWNYGAAAHLLNRAGLGGTPREIEQLRALGLTAAVDRLLQTPAEPIEVASHPWSQPIDLRAKRAELVGLKDEPGEQKARRKEMRQEQHSQLQELRFWWLNRMMTTGAPLVEKMTLFWHGHFATSAQKVKGAYAMWRQNALFREHALGHFPTLLKAVSRDPAMMVYLDLQQSKKESPNENWAREVMELFTLGIGNYSEADVKGAARAFTGYRIDPARQEFRFVASQHDEGLNTFLGKSGDFSGDDVLDVIVAQPACPRFIGRKLWLFFVEDAPAPATIEAMAGLLLRHEFQLRPVLREIFMSQEFYAPLVRRAQIKSPVQFLVQSCKMLETDLPPAPACEGALRSMGQVLLAPPNVKGWDGGKSWISTATLLFRYNFANYLLNGLSPQANAPPALQRDPVNMEKLLSPEQRARADEVLEALSTRLFQAPLEENQAQTLRMFLQDQSDPAANQTLRRLLHLMMSTPQFQLT